MTEHEVLDQLDQIAEQQPVPSGKLINKQAKKELIHRGWIMFYSDDSDFKIEGEKKGLGGYVLTELGYRGLNH